MYVFLLLLFCLQVLSQNMFLVSEGDECLRKNGVKGICRREYGCVRTKTSKFDSDRQSNEQCGYTGSTPLKCCIPSTKLARKACRKYQDEVPRKSSYAISGGRDAEPGEFPHMVALWYPPTKKSMSDDTQWKCGGTLISDFYVLTAAHCIIDAAPTKMRVGDLNLKSTDDDDNAKTYDIGEVIMHPKYNPTKSLYNDIGLLKSTEKISFGYYVYPACINDDVSTFGYSIVGWGALGFNEKTALDVTQPLKVAIVDGATNKNCSEYYKDEINSEKLKRGIADSQVCARSPPGERGNTCGGDSGGPLQYAKGDMYYIVGVTSYGWSCGDSRPGIYTRVRKFAHWIETMVWGRLDNPPGPRNQRSRDNCNDCLRLRNSRQFCTCFKQCSQTEINQQAQARARYQCDN